MRLEQEITTRLEAAFAPTHLQVRNESHLHAGHAGDDGSGESHWHIEITAPAFAGMGRVAQHRAVHRALGEDVIGRIHALGMTVTAG